MNRSNVQTAANYLANKLQPNNNSTNPVEALNLEELAYLQKYLEALLVKKIKQQNLDNGKSNVKIQPGSRGSECTRQKRSTQYTNYQNPYEYGARQNPLPPKYIEPYVGNYDLDTDIINQMGISNYQHTDHIRNIGVESSLLQQEMTHLPGQRELTEIEFDRFEQLPFNPQNSNHIIWNDNMPRGGYSTRNDRLEL